MKKLLFPLFFMLTILLVACSSAPSPELLMDIPAKPDVIRVGVTSALAQLETDGTLYSCAQEVEVIAEVLPWQRLKDLPQDVYLLYGEGDRTLTENVYQIGESPLVFIVHPTLPIDQISFEQIQAIYSNQMVNWVEYAITSSYMGLIEVWGYMENTEIMQYTLDALNLPAAAGQWNAAPSPAELMESVANDRNAVGVIPAFALTEDFNTVSISGTEFSPIPILAAWTHEPTQAEQDWLLCVQSALD